MSSGLVGARWCCMDAIEYLFIYLSGTIFDKILKVNNVTWYQMLSAFDAMSY